MRLTENQIEALYKFTRQHYVYHYDVQTELVDHLANDIESIWKETPKVSFEEARDTSFKKFGVFGFMDVIEAKQKQMNKRYWKIILRFAKEWFTLPKILITLGLFFAIFVLLQIPYFQYVILGILVFLAVFEMIAVYKIRKKQKNKERTHEKVFLLEAMIGTTQHGYSVLMYINVFNFFNLSRIEFSTLSSSWLAFIALLSTLVVILFYVSNYVLPQKAEELLQETYPEYKLVKNL